MDDPTMLPAQLADLLRESADRLRCVIPAVVAACNLLDITAQQVTQLGAERDAALARLAELQSQVEARGKALEWVRRDSCWSSMDHLAAAAGVAPALLVDIPEMGGSIDLEVSPVPPDSSDYLLALDLVLYGEQAQRAGNLSEAACIFRAAGLIQAWLVAALPADRVRIREVFGQSAGVLLAKAEALERAVREPQEHLKCSPCGTLEDISPWLALPQPAA